MSQLRYARLFCLALGCTAIAVSSLYAQPQKTQAQRLVDATVKKHPEIAGLEMSSTPPAKHTCITIAATEPKDLGEKCDRDEFTALANGKPFVEHEPDGFDVTAPLHDSKGKVVGTLGIDFKPKPGQTKADVLKLTAELVKEVEQQIPSKAFLFQPVQ